MVQFLDIGEFIETLLLPDYVGHLARVQLFDLGEKNLFRSLILTLN